MDKTEMLEYLHYIPITIFVAFPTTVIFTYAIAVVLGHVDGVFPYISDTTTYPPESCIFAQAMNMIAVLMCVFVYIRYGQIKECTTEFRSNASLSYWNRAAFFLGLITNLGLSIVANFQETSSLVVHLIGAFMCFGGGTLYFWSQAVCSYYLQPVGCSLKLAHARLALSVLATICFVVGLICGILSFRIPTGNHGEKSSEEVRSSLHLASTVAEWLCAVTFCCNVLTFIEEFHTTQLSCPRVTYNPGGAMTISNEILNVCQEDGVTRIEQGSPNTGRTAS